MIASATGALALVGALLWYFHDRFWWPVDEGVYAYVAQRLLAGDRLHVDLIDLHGGYGNLINALAFIVFGEDLLSLRYPLVVVTLAQSALGFWLLKERGALPAALAALAIGTLSFIQFLNPSANWYALFLSIVTIVVAHKIDASNRRGLIILGLLLGTCFLTRQLTGVILGTGVVTWLLLKLSEGESVPGRAGQLLCVILGVGVGAYVLSKGSATALFYVGVWPLALIGIAATHVRLGAARLATTLAWLSTGATIAALPLALYHASQGTLIAWVYDLFVTALLIHGQDFIAQADYSSLLVSAMLSVTSPASPAAALGALGWIVAIALVPTTGYLCVRHLAAIEDPTSTPPLPIIAPFFALVSIHYQIPIYLFFALPIVAATLLWLIPKRSTLSVVALLTTWAVVFHAGQPLSRGEAATIEGRRVDLGERAKLPRASLRIGTEDEVLYTAVIDRIEADARPDEALMTLPMDPELNFMTGRKSPVDYYGTPLGLKSERDLERTLERLREAAPLFVVHRRDDKYLTPLSARLLEEIRGLSAAPVSIGPFDLYRFLGPARNELTLAPDRG